LLFLVGQGKSTISAAICHRLLGLYDSEEKIEPPPSPVIAAAHFLRYSDAKMLDPVKMIKSLAYQLARQLPDFAKAILDVDALALDQLTSFEEAFDLLLAHLPNKKAIFILIDALDESDPLQQQQAGNEKIFKPVANRAVYALTSLLIPKLPNVRFIFTTRPDAMGGNVEKVLCRSFADSTKVVMYCGLFERLFSLCQGCAKKDSSYFDSIRLVAPSDLRVVHESDHQEGRVMVFDSIVRGCPQISFGPLPPCPNLDDTYRAYKIVLDECNPSSEVRDLLNVIVAAQVINNHLMLATLPNNCIQFHHRSL